MSRESNDANKFVAQDVAAVIDVLRRSREGRGWPVDELGRRAGISARQLQQIEEGAADLRYLQFLQICAAMEISPVSVVQQACQSRKT